MFLTVKSASASASIPPNARVVGAFAQKEGVVSLST